MVVDIKAVHDSLFKIEVEVLEDGFLPTKKFKSDAGFDLYTPVDICLYPGQVLKIPLNIRMKLPTGSWANITTKSGLGAKGQLVYAGIIDEGYRGIPHVVMTNVKLIGDPIMTDWMPKNIQPIVLKRGDKVAQFIMSPYSQEFYIVQVDKVDTDTERGIGGFGSTGK